MKTLIVYASRTGATEKCAKLLQEKLPEATLCHVSSCAENLADYDTVVVGSPIRMGSIDKQIKKFIKKNAAALKEKKTAYFICCGAHRSKHKYFEDNFKKEWLESAFLTESFGGEMDLTKLKGFDKFVAKMGLKTLKEGESVCILPDVIDAFAEKLVNG